MLRIIEEIHRIYALFGEAFIKINFRHDELHDDDVIIYQLGIISSMIKSSSSAHTKISVLSDTLISNLVINCIETI